ncbi:MAG: zinc ribbon domain-containing protein [Muribaculaceae bacterium]|nr:zinc ribbon domain-containing protein [Muribaculaceae bacterium]
MKRCQHCGHEVPEDSAFCNHCGYRISNEVTCSYCHQSMPAESVFCPHCGKAVDNAMHKASQEQRPTREEQPQRMTYNEQRQAAQRQAAQRQAAQRQANAWKQPESEDQDDDDNNDGDGRSSFNRNLIIGVIAAAVLIGLLSMLRHCNSQENDRLEARADSAALIADGSQEPMAILNAELSRNNFTDDKAYAGCAVRFNSSDPDTPERIIGVTYKEDTERPFIKIYNLTRDGAQWKTELGQTKYYDGRTIIMDHSSLIADAMNVPRAVTVDGKQYLYFAFLNHLKGAGEGNNGRVTLALYDVEGKKLTTLTYDGTIRSRSDGRQYVYCRGPLENTSSSERRFLQQEAASIGSIHVATQDEIDAEEEAKAEEEEQKSLEGEENADAKWDHDNAENMGKLKEGEEVKMKPTQYDKPIINMKEIKDKLENDRYLVFLDTKGSVVGFNKSSRKYFTIYGGKSGSASGISFNGDNSVLIKTPGGSITYDLVHDKAKSAN